MSATELEQALALLRRVSSMNYYRFFDEGGNKVCSCCGFFRDYQQINGKPAGTHKSDCVIADVRTYLESLVSR